MSKQRDDKPGIEAAVANPDVVIGLADVDPEPLSTVGEALDPEATKEAHESGQAQRDKLPVR